MRVANLSVNGMARHWPRVRDWLGRRRPDVATLQKTGRAADFPAEELRAMGYGSVRLDRRSASDLGVAVLTSRRTLPGPRVRARALPGGAGPESRFLMVGVGALRVASVYAPYNPAGGDRRQAVGDRVAWLERLRACVGGMGPGRGDCLLCGDFNVKLAADGPRGSGFYSRAEEEALERILDLGFVDLYRAAHPDPGASPGRTFGFDRRPGGTSRLHLALGSRGLARRLRTACVDVEARPRRTAAPLVLEFG